jgi:hypothetical protein
MFLSIYLGVDEVILEILFLTLFMVTRIVARN